MDDDARLTSLEARLEDLFYRLEKSEAHLLDAVKNFENLYARLRDVEVRLNPLAPKRHHCPKCKALLHPKAVHCRCGWAKDGHSSDPLAGQPT